MNKTLENVNNNCIVLILAAGDISSKFKFHSFFYKSPALIPIGSKTLLGLVVEKFIEYGLKEENIYVAINGEEADLVKTISKNIKIIPIFRSEGVVDTLNKSLEYIKYEGDLEIIINLVTTIPNIVPKKNTIVLSKDYYEDVNFSLIDFNGKDVIFYFKSFYPKKGFAFTGLFRSTISIIKSIIHSLEKVDDLLLVIKYMYDKYNLEFIFDDWIDFGHEINFSNSKVKLINSRKFNNFEVDSLNSTIRKISNKNEKLKAEYKYISMLPEEIKILFPRIISFDESGNKTSITMEYYGYRSLSELFVFYAVSNEEWFRIFSKIKSVLELFSKYNLPLSEKLFIEFYLNKLKERISDFYHQLPEEYKWIITEEEININNNYYKNVNVLMKKIEEKIRSLYDQEDFCIMHGDFCFSNILYDLDSDIIKLLDPRGSFGNNYTIYGDIKYDLAKLMHSVHGLYDSILYNFYELSINEKLISYEILKPSNFEITQKYLNKLIVSLNKDINDIKFLMALLFLTMPPLHYEDKNRQILFYIHGLKILNEVINSGDN